MKGTLGYDMGEAPSVTGLLAEVMTWHRGPEWDSLHQCS